ncbi:MAG: murein biosynthesis integral membrane protein MurJ [Candidatus Omnitrophota bacterium]
MKSIVKSFSRVSFFTLCSRILGFARDIVIAGFFGTSSSLDAFFVAFRIPNLFRDIIGEGAASSALVPVFSEYSVKHKKESYLSLILSIFILLSIILVIIVILGVLLAPFVVRVIAPGFISSPDKLNLTIEILKINFPYVFFIGLVALLMAFLNTEGVFSISALSPCFLNIAMIFAIFLTFNRLHQPIFSLALGVLAGGLLQFVMHIISSAKKFYDLSKGADFKMIKIDIFHPAVNKIFKLIIPRIFGTIVYQLNVFMDTILASLSWIVGEGAVSAVYYANHLIQFPLGIFSTAMMTAILPSLSKKIAQGQAEEHRNTLIFSLKAIFFIMIPCLVALFILAHPVIQVLFQRGKFTSYSTNITSFALMFFSLGLPFYASARIMASNFYSRQDTATPVKIAFLSLLLNLCLNLILIWPLKVGGLALASAISSAFNFLMLHAAYKKTDTTLFTKNLQQFILKVCYASLVMGLFLYVFWRFVRFDIIVKLIFVIIIGTAVYMLITNLLGIKKINQIIKWTLKN